MDDYDNYSYSYYFDDDNSTFESANFSFNLDCESTHLPGSRVFLPFLYSLIFFTGFFGNLFVILVVGSKGSRGGRLVDTFVINLALADLIFVFTLPLWAISARQNGNWNFGPAGDLLCKLSSYVIAVNRFSNIFLLTCMSVDRYLAIVRLMDSRYLRNSGCIRSTCAVVWGISLVIGIPSLVYRSVESSGEEQFCVEDNDSAFFLGMSLTVATLTFVLPVLIIIFCYGAIIRHLEKHCIVGGNQRAEARRKHSFKMVLCIVVAFIVSWLPFNSFRVIIVISYISKADLSCVAWLKDGLQISCCLAFLNSCVNPIIYFFLDHHFRKRATLLYHYCSGKKKSLLSYNSSASLSNTGTESSATNGGRAQLQSF